ncbi:fumarate reductase/succinate dehydrogenase flavoprotein subunit [Candidatus Thioglobus sp.]|jgi:succinate dehydrogenase / fumarate reductase flavoprotein subunit|uniref:fumarate reductase/succinate dehydrogenase flavoprotein subunit n=1 Tax=Candidatus Thioglobus sp. TaxID=2026721 RepID=UPI001E0B8EA7|nr:fumarate reductase/succinate dehydrogenase flavoprotein subunit [Candidatus Thioglobus sp.]MBT3277301.1 fumarate reductase/succinate dehydrogenase flavoprotein subunit [Candidatus Thioglobus sp.]MBT3447559.1 fumarate reductase/succinate dehydrogenase flavoprotein subunit [Candidatus Thioglobus sp.]MBT4001400.1 fumarate reductase/succinate dehydrogenase flavoprotein subunit [Candidatus Thioglobus sp.]MBT4181557.1 fumarate reductase/succinate dehydrogenase flavoprotein subunit [Candidatus Thio
MSNLYANEPTGPLESRWEKHLFNLSLIAPQNRKKHKVIVVGTGLAGASLCATLGEAGYQVSSFCFQDSPRRAHSIAAQGGINATKNYQNDGDSVWRLFYDTIKGGDFRARESNVYRLAELSGNIIDQAVAQGVPFAREYSGYLANRSFGGTQVSRTFYARGQTGQQLLLGAYQAHSRQLENDNVTHQSRSEMLEIIMVDDKARGVVVRDLVTGEISAHTADCVILCTGGYSNAFYLSTNAKGCNTSATWRAYKQGAYFANPSFTQIHPTCVPPTGENQSKLTLMSESLRNDGRIWAPKNIEDCEKNPADIKEEDRDYFLERMYPAFANLVPRDVASRAVKHICDQGHGVGSKIHGQRLGVYLDFSAIIEKLGLDAVAEKYGNLFDMYSSITGEDPYQTPMKIYPAPHYTMGGLWVDYNLMTSVEGLFAGGEANFSDHGANRLGASALMQGLADGYFILPKTVANYLSRNPLAEVDDNHPQVVQSLKAVRDRIQQLMHAPQPKHSPEYFHQKLGKILWEACGMSREADRLNQAIGEIAELEAHFWQNIKVTGVDNDLNQTLERAGRVADFIELGKLMCQDALMREESCGAHARVEYLSEGGEAKRDDDDFSFVGAWEYKPEQPMLHKEQLNYEFIELTVRNYK